MRILATSLLLLYVSVSCRPVFPVLADALAHLLWYEQHLETVHMHDGHAHVHHEIVDAAAEPGSPDSAPVPAKTFKLNDLLAAHFRAEEHVTNVYFAEKQERRSLIGEPFLWIELYRPDVPVPPPDYCRYHDFFCVRERAALCCESALNHSFSPDCRTWNSAFNPYWNTLFQTYAASGQHRSGGVCRFMNDNKTGIPFTS